MRNDHGTADLLRARLPDPEQTEAMESRGRAAAVLVPLFGDGEKLSIVMTVRRSDLRRHPGEISFPGGRHDPGETNLYATALREADEEIGLPSGRVELVGALPPTSTFVSDYAIYPYVALIEPLNPWKPNPLEVAQVLEFSLRDLTAGYRKMRLPRRGVPFRTPTYTVDEYFVWGATARIVESLLRYVRPAGIGHAASPETVKRHP